MQIEMFDIKMITINLENPAIKEFIIDELWGNNSKWASSFQNIDNKEVDSNSHLSEVKPGEVFTNYNIEKTLHEREKCTKLDEYQRNFLITKVIEKGADVRCISSEFRISKNVLYNLRKKIKYNDKMIVNTSKDNTKFVDINKLVEIIDQIVIKSTTPITSRDIKEQPQNLYEIHAPIHKIHCILKESLNYSYK